MLHQGEEKYISRPLTFSTLKLQQELFKLDTKIKIYNCCFIWFCLSVELEFLLYNPEQITNVQSMAVVDTVVLTNHTDIAAVNFTSDGVQFTSTQHGLIRKIDVVESTVCYIP